MAARKARAYKVVGAAAVIRKAKGERYLKRGAIVPADALDEDNAKHLLRVGLIEAVDLPDPEAQASGDTGSAGTGSGDNGSAGDGSGSGSGSADSGSSVK